MLLGALFGRRQPAAPSARTRRSEEYYPYYEAADILIPAPPKKPSAFRGFTAYALRPVLGAAVVCVVLAVAALVLPILDTQALRQAIARRAAIDLQDDFRSGLSAWSGAAGWAKTWSYDQAGFVRPGRLGLWQHTLPLADYRLEFLGQIERGALSWVFRAADSANYAAARIRLTQVGPLPSAELVHYSVTNGRPGPKATVPLPFQVRMDTLYTVQVTAEGDQFSVYVNGRLVDSWTERRLRSGGVGFLAEPGEAARVRWVRVSGQDDLLGRLLAYLEVEAPSPREPRSVAAVRQN